MQNCRFDQSHSGDSFKPEGQKLIQICEVQSQFYTQLRTKFVSFIIVY